MPVPLLLLLHPLPLRPLRPLVDMSLLLLFSSLSSLVSPRSRASLLSLAVSCFSEPFIPPRLSSLVSIVPRRFSSVAVSYSSRFLSLPVSVTNDTRIERPSRPQGSKDQSSAIGINQLVLNASDRNVLSVRHLD